MADTSSDMEMTEVADVTSNGGDDVIAPLLSLARQFVDHGKPSQALQAVVMAMRAKGGEQAVIHILERARQLYRSKLHSSSQADQLASLFAHCAISEAQPQPPQPQQPQQPPQPSVSCFDIIEGENSILAESGRRQLMVDAFSDGTNFICLQCGGLVSKVRKDEHYAYWCQF